MVSPPIVLLFQVLSAWSLSAQRRQTRVRNGPTPQPDHEVAADVPPNLEMAATGCITARLGRLFGGTSPAEAPVGDAGTSLESSRSSRRDTPPTPLQRGELLMEGSLTPALGPRAAQVPGSLTSSSSSSSLRVLASFTEVRRFLQTFGFI